MDTHKSTKPYSHKSTKLYSHKSTKPYSHKSTTIPKNIFVPSPHSNPRPPTTSHPRYHITEVYNDEVYNDEVSNDEVSNDEIIKHNADVEDRLKKHGPRPYVIPNNTPSIPDKSFKVQPSIGNRTNWNVLDYEKDERPSEKRPRYHADNICGSGFDGLATTIEIKLNEGKIGEAINQLNTCIKERRLTTRDKSHQNVILILENFLKKVKNYEDPVLLNNVINHGGFIVRYNEYIGRLAEFDVIQRRKISFTRERFSAGKYKKTYRKRRNKRSIKRYTKKSSLKQKYKRL